MKIILVDSGREWRGGQAQVLALARGLRQRRCDCTVAAKQGSELADRVRKEGLECVELPMRFEMDLHSAHSLARLAHGSGTLFHVHTPHALGVALCARMIGPSRPIIFTRHTSFPIKKLFVNRWKINQAQMLVAVSNIVAAELVHSGFPEDRIRVIHGCVDVDRFPFRPLPGEQPRHLAVIGAVEKAKGLDMALEFASRMKDRPFVIDFVGTGPDVPLVEEVARRNSGVTCRGFVADIPALMETVFAVLSFSPKEGFPVSLLEAMASGRPVVAFANPSAQELVVHGETGFLFETVEEACSQALTLSESPEKAAAIGKHASEYVAARFSADRMTEETLQLYNQILSA